MINKININPVKQKLIIYVVLTLATLAVYWQVNQYSFVNLDDNFYVTQNHYVQSGITTDGFCWAFRTTYAEFWHPLTWLSLMFDYQLYGTNAGGYHFTNLILHILSTLLLFWLFNRMTKEIWPSAFVAALFALHPLHVESVAWIAERKDVLSAFFWMLTLCLYVCYTEKPSAKRYLPVLFSFAGALMSKAMVVTLPIIMILLDYWPLKRFDSQKGNPVIWQLKEKTPFFVLSAVISLATLYAEYNPLEKGYSLSSRLANAPVAFAAYLKKIFWPYDLSVFYPFSDQLPGWQVWGTALLIFFISAAVIDAVKRMPYLFVGWFWYMIILLPVAGIIQFNPQAAMADRYTYLPSIGIFFGLAWGIGLLFPREDLRKKILFPAGMIFLTIMALLAWRQCGYWRSNLELFNHAVQVTKNDALMHHLRGAAFAELGRYQHAIEDFNEAIRLKPDDAESYFNRGNVYAELGQYQRTIEDCTEAIRLKPDYVYAYNNRGVAYLVLGNKALGCRDLQKACDLGNCTARQWAESKGSCR
jgi:tetratricopeptide (TPR) repeat protein